MEQVGLTTLSGIVIRRVDGIVTFWSPGMEERYGFSYGDAFGRVSSELLRTIFPRARAEIEADFLEEGTWIGGVFNYRADGGQVATALRWDAFPGVDGRGSFIAETHSNIRRERADTVCLLGDLMEIIARELSEALTAVNAYNFGTRLALEQNLPGEEALRGATARSADQIRRSTNALHLLHGVVNAIQGID